jgi:hypothetical protein
MLHAVCQISHPMRWIIESTYTSDQNRKLSHAPVAG